jgi:Zn finger protein HypA/HybF involved in hydrogenase expression
MDREALKGYLEQGLSLPEIGRLVGRDPSTVGYWVQKHGLVANGRDRFAPKGGLTREQLESLLERRLPLTQVAGELGVSVSTVRHWVKKHELKIRRRPRRGGDGEARPREIQWECLTHGLTDFILENRGAYRCKRCRSEAVSRRRRRVKEILVQEAGGRCAICGYDRCAGALEFHHLDPAQKSFGVATGGVTVAIAKLRAEAKKCVLLCATCHAEVEAGVSEVPIK